MVGITFGVSYYIWCCYRRVLTEDATKTVMQSLVMSRLDYCNALLIGIQHDLIAKLQRLQNSGGGGGGGGGVAKLGQYLKLPKGASPTPGRFFKWVPLGTRIS